MLADRQQYIASKLQETNPRSMELVMAKSSDRAINIGFISFRFQGTDGVSLETSKWADVLEGMGHTCYYFSGLSDRPPERSMVVGEAHFLEAETREFYTRLFGSTSRSEADTRWIHARREMFKEHLYSFIRKYFLTH